MSLFCLAPESRLNQSEQNTSTGLHGVLFSLSFWWCGFVVVDHVHSIDMRMIYSKHENRLDGNIVFLHSEAPAMQAS